MFSFMKVEFENGFAKDFRMAVGEFFKDALAKEHFHAGDIIYDAKDVYAPSWAEALPHVKYAFQVVQMVGAEIEYNILRPNAKGASLVAVKRIKEPIDSFLQQLKNGI